MIDFEQHVTDSLARLETKMDTLVGPEGRVTKLENTVFKLILIGIAVAVLILGPTAIATLVR